MQATLYLHHFGNLKDLTNTGEVAVAFNGATSTIHGTFSAKVILTRKYIRFILKLSTGHNTTPLSVLAFSTAIQLSSNFQRACLLSTLGK